MRAGNAAATLVAVASSLGAAGTAEAQTFDIAPGPLGEVAAALGAQAHITIAVPDPELARRLSPGVRGRFSPRVALERALRGTGAEAVFYDEATVRITRAREKFKRVTDKPVLPRPAKTSAEPSDIVITASKQNMLLRNYPGSAKVIDVDPSWLSRNAAKGTAALSETSPTLSSTNLGRGRNKLYVRGIADSSFNGPTQATVGQYLADARMNYAAPDPDLNLYDMRRVEVLAGPQGTLYGAGSLGGVVRLLPNEPDWEASYATAAAGLSTTRFGGFGADAAAMLNLPIGDRRMALRLVAYAAREPGYIDDRSRGLRDINDSRSFGYRLAFHADDVAGWSVNVGGVFQDIKVDDGQYTVHGAPALTRSNTLAQPFRNDYRLVYVSGTREVIGGAELISTTSVVWHDLQTLFDATGVDGTTLPRMFDERNSIILLSTETRLSGGSGKAHWVAGMSGVYNVSRISRRQGAPEDPQRVTGVRNRQAEASVFAQASVPISAPLTATAGGRLTVSDGAGMLLGGENAGKRESSNVRARFAGTLALDWQVTPSLSLFLHYQDGFRPGGFAVAPIGSSIESQEFEADDLSQMELGIRWRDGARDRLSARGTIFALDWDHIQADLVDSSGLPTTRNIGDGRIYGIDGEIRWRASPVWTLTVAAFLNESRMIGTDARIDAEEVTLPNIPRDGIRINSEWRFELGGGVAMTAETWARYVGKSNLGATPPMNGTQGQYLVAGAGARIDFRRVGVSLDVANLADARANTFAFGNPFALGREDQITPLRPRTIRLGFDARF